MRVSTHWDLARIAVVKLVLQRLEIQEVADVIPAHRHVRPRDHEHFGLPLAGLVALGVLLDVVPALLVPICMTEQSPSAWHPREERGRPADD